MMNLDESKYRGASAWQKDAYSFTTGQFAKLDRKYRRHCGPTAITNLLYTLAQREGRPIEEYGLGSAMALAVRKYAARSGLMR